MYAYKPKKKFKHWETLKVLSIFLVSGLISLILVSFEDSTYYVDNGDNEPVWKPCELRDVVCEGEELHITPANSKVAIDIILQKYFGDNWKLARAVMMSEGNYDVNAFNPKNGSNDRGIWQISRKYHPDVSDECAKDIECSTKYAYKLSRGGTDWTPWYGYVYGGYKEHL